MSQFGKKVIQAAREALAYARGEQMDAQITRVAVRRKEAIERGEMGTISHEDMIEEFAPELRVFPRELYDQARELTKDVEIDHDAPIEGVETLHD